MNQKSKSQLNEEIRDLKLKLDILKKNVMLLGRDPDDLILRGMFYARSEANKNLKPIDTLVADLIGRRRSAGRLYMTTTGVRDCIKHAVHRDKQKGLTKEIRLSLERMEADGVVDVSGISIRIK